MFEAALATNTRLPAQLVSTAVAAPVVRNGEPGAGVSNPPALMAYTPAASCDFNPTTRNLPFAVTFKPSENAPALNGELETSLNAPVLEMLKVRRNVVDSSVTKRK